ncbi:hypothetical protein [Rhodococcus opacus]|uniref:hypothetical protein n=1 Tax=Rhodococcus opacus TaxID=37919 RepID=UPI002953DFBF|nr:hypothetical protein [Rhodococcus opacus]MDV7084037.1 hypothetical protein [Rhodococcus opacus]
MAENLTVRGRFALWVRDGLAALAVRYGVADVQVTSVDVAPGEMLDVAVRNPAKSDQFDRCTCDGEWLSEPSPVMVSVLEDLDARAFTISDVPVLSRVESRVDDGFAYNCFEEGRVAGISVNRVWPTVFVVCPGLSTWHWSSTIGCVECLRRGGENSVAGSSVV